MKNPVLEAKSRQMLELLAEGASARTIGRKMGYSEGTVRVYLHHLYKAIGVKNRSQAMLWQINRTRPPEPREVMPPPAVALKGGEGFADMALAESLYGALGIMESFLGPFGRLWEAGRRMKGSELDPRTAERRAETRALWRALLRGDFAFGKRVYDEGEAARLLQEAGPAALLLVVLLLVGGFSTAAESCLGQLARRKAPGGLSAREMALLTAVREAVAVPGEAGALQRYAGERSVPVMRQVATAVLFHVHRLRKDAERARVAADGLWVEAESARGELEAMGVRLLPREAGAPRAGKAAKPTAAVREKVAATR